MDVEERLRAASGAWGHGNREGETVLRGGIHQFSIAAEMLSERRPVSMTMRKSLVILMGIQDLDESGKGA